MAFSDSPWHNIYKEKPYIDPKNPPSIARLLSKGARFNDDFQKNIDVKVEDLRDKFDLPFDELYHKEKKLIDQVVKAEKALKEKQSKLPNPFGANRLYNPNELPEEITRDPLY